MGVKHIVLDNRDLNLSIDSYETFTGYSTFEYMEQMAAEHYKEDTGKEFSYDELEVERHCDMTTVVDLLAKASLDVFVNELKTDALKKILSNEKFVAAKSPEYYNYTTDSYTFEADIDLMELDEYILEHQQEYDEYLRESGWDNEISYKKSCADEMYSRTDDGNPWRLERFEDKWEKFVETSYTAMLAFIIDKECDKEIYESRMREAEDDIYYENTETNIVEKVVEKGNKSPEKG